MRKLLITLALTCFGFASVAHAQGGFSGPNARGGFDGPNAADSITTVEQAKGMRDDTYVTLRGNIIEQISNDDYIFKDATGTIRVDIDADKWGGQTVKPEHTVEIYGEVDRNRRSIEIDVKTIRIVQ